MENLLEKNDNNSIDEFLTELQEVPKVIDRIKLISDFAEKISNEKMISHENVKTELLERFEELLEKQSKENEIKSIEEYMYSIEQNVEQFIMYKKETETLTNRAKHLIMKRTYKLIRINKGYELVNIVISRNADLDKIDKTENVKRLTNFEFSNIRKLTKSTQEKYKIANITVYLNDGAQTVNDVIISEGDFSKHGDLRKSIRKLSRGFLTTTITADEFDSLVTGIDNMSYRDVLNVEYLGLHYIKEVPVCLVVREGTLKVMAPENIEISREFFYEHINKYSHSDYHYPHSTKEEWEETVKVLLSNFPNIYTQEKMLVILAWFLASKIKPLFLENDTLMSQINLFGIRGTGKTTIMEIISAFFGRAGQLPKFSTEFVGTKGLAYSNIQPYIVDEFRRGVSIKEQEKVNRLNELQRIAYNEGVSSRGNKEQGQNDWRLIAPFGLCGEDQVNDKATAERMLQIRFTKSEHKMYSQISKDSFTALQKFIKPEKFVTGYTQWLLNNYTQWNDWLDEATTFVMNNFAHAHDSIRVVKGFVAIAMGLKIAELLAKKLGIEVEPFEEKARYRCIEWALKHQEEESTESIDTEYLMFLTQRVGAGYSTNTIKIQDGMLYFDKMYWAGKFIEYKRKLGESMLSKEALNKAMEESEACVDSSKPKKIGGKTRKCFMFDIKKIESCHGIEEDLWIDNSDGALIV
jgi:hypothetical protein